MEKAEGVVAEMREHLRLLRERGVDPYPRRWERTHLSSDIAERFGELSGAEVAVAGRLTAIRGHGNPRVCGHAATSPGREPEEPGDRRSGNI